MGWLDQYYRISTAAGVAVHMRRDNSLEVAACVLSAKRKELIIDQKLTAVQDFKTLAKNISVKTPVALNISGKGVLIKQVEGNELLNFSQLFPNANADDFYIQQFQSGGKIFAAIIRKSEARRLVEMLSEAGFHVLAISLGPFPVYIVQEQLNFYDDALYFAGHEVTRDESKGWIAYSYNDSQEAGFPVKIDNETIAPELLIPYAAAFQLILTDKLDPVKADAPEIDAQYQRLAETIRFKTHGVILLIIFFIILLLNAILFSTLNNSNSRLQEQVSVFAQSSNNREQLTAQLAQKKALIKTLGWDGGLHKSTLIDQVASLMPAGLRLSKVTVNPPDPEKSRVNKTAVFFDRTIRIEGLSAQIIPVNEWLARVKSRRWVKDVQLESYNWNSELNIGQFTLLIHY